MIEGVLGTVPLQPNQRSQTNAFSSKRAVRFWVKCVSLNLTRASLDLTRVSLDLTRVSLFFGLKKKLRFA